MGETPRTRDELEGLLEQWADLRGEQILARLERHGLRIVSAQPTEEMMDAIQVGDTCLEAWKAALALSPFAPEEQTPAAEAGEDKPEGA